MKTYQIKLLPLRNSLGKPQQTIFIEKPNGVKDIVCNVYGSTISEAKMNAKIIANALNKYKSKEKPVQIEIGEWLYKGNFIQEQNHPELPKFRIFGADKEQTHVGTCNTFAQAKNIAELNENKEPYYTLDFFL